MSSFVERMDEMEEGLSRLSEDVKKIKEMLKNFTGAPPLIKGYAGAQFMLNDKLDVIELRKELAALKKAVEK